MIQSSNKLSQASELTEWHIQDINDAIKEADAGDFATEEEVNAVFDKWKTKK